MQPVDFQTIAKQLGVTVETVYDYRNKGMKHHRIGRRYFAFVEHAQAFKRWRSLSSTRTAMLIAGGKLQVSDEDRQRARIAYMQAGGRP